MPEGSKSSADLPAPEVISAVDIATRLTARRFWWERLRTITISVLVTLVIAGLASWAIGHRLVQDARNNSTQNCSVQANGRPSGNQRALTSQIILGLANDLYMSLPPKFQQIEVDKINRQLRLHYRILGFTKRSVLQVTKLTDLSPLLAFLPLIDCSATIQ